MQPLDYVIWESTITNEAPHPSFLDKHMVMGPFKDKSFTVDVATVHAIIINLRYGNNTVDANLQRLMSHQGGKMG